MSYHIQIDAIPTNPGDLLSFPPTDGQASPDGLYVLYALKLLDAGCPERMPVRTDNYREAGNP